MDINGSESIPEDTVSLASYYDNPETLKSSSSFEDQSDDESESDQNDHEADIDKMLLDLEGFQMVSGGISSGK